LGGVQFAGPEEKRVVVGKKWPIKGVALNVGVRLVIKKGLGGRSEEGAREKYRSSGGGGKGRHSLIVGVEKIWGVIERGGKKMLKKEKFLIEVNHTQGNSSLSLNCCHGINPGAESGENALQ